MKKIFALYIALIMLLSCAAPAENTDASVYGRAKDSFSAYDLDGALALFTAAGNYADASEYADYIKVIQLGLSGMYIPAETTIKTLYSSLDSAAEYQAYFRALDLMEKGDYISAEGLLSGIEYFFDSETLLDRVNALYTQSVYTDAEAFIAAGDYASAAEVYSMMDDPLMVKETWYQKAEALREQGEYAAAAEVYASIIGYKDTVEKYSLMLSMEKVMGEYVIGSTVTFGRYPVSSELISSSETTNEYEEIVYINNYAYHSAPIEWVVLDVQDGKALLMSKYGIDSQIYYGYSEGLSDGFEDINYSDETGSSDFVTWRTSYLRAWLNTVFLGNAFNAAEYSLIRTADVKAEINPRFRTEAGSDTRDKVYVLSISELEKYLPTNEDRVCAATNYAVVTRAAGINQEGNCWYWTRCAGDGDKMTAVVLRDGSISYTGRAVGDIYTAVRPVIWVSIY